MATLTLERLSSRRRASPVLAGAALAPLSAASGALLVILGTRLTFFNDDWWFLLQRPGLESRGGLDVLLAPHNGNLAAVFAAIYKALVAVFGSGPQLPFRLVIAVATVSLGVLVYVIVAERMGPPIGLAAAALVLFLGPAWEALLFLDGSNHLDAVVLGLGALLALEVDSPRRNALACVLLVLAVSVSNTGIAFVAGAVVAVLLRRRPTELWIPAVSVALYVMWWGFYGHKQPTYVTLGHIEHLPRYLFDSVSIGLASITGLEQPSLPGTVSSGHILTVLAAVLVVVWLVRGGRPTAWALVFAVTLVAFWLLTGATAIPGRAAASSRYQLTDSVLLIVFAAELGRGTRLADRRLWPAAAVITVAIVASNLLLLRDAYDFLRVQSGYARADLGALRIAGPRAPATLSLTAPVARNSFLSGITAGRYFSVASAHGTPPFDSPTQILAAPPAQRQAADSVLVAAYGISPELVRSVGSAGGCGRLAGGAERAVRPPGAAIRNLGSRPLVIGVARFAPHGLPVNVGFLPGHATARVGIPSDAVGIEWRVTVRQAGTPGAGTEICQLIS